MTLVTGTSILGSLGIWLGPLIIESAVKATLLLAVAAAVTLALRNNSAGRRHAIWAAAFVAIALIPCAAHLLPGWHILPAGKWLATDELADLRSSRGEPDEVYSNLPPEQLPRDSLSESTQSLQDSVRDLDWPSALPPVQQLDVSSATRLPVASHRSTGDQTPPNDRSQADARAVRFHAGISCLGLVWLGGVLLCCGRLLISGMNLHRLASTSEELRSGTMFDLHESICRRLRIERPVRLFLGRSNCTPMAWGVLRPCLILPRDASAWKRDRLNAVLIHELGHISRRDPLVQWIVQITRTLYWFHPLVWWAAIRIQVERERACDDLVINSGLEVTDYAEHLLHIASGFRTREAMVLTGIAMAAPRRLEGRLLALLNKQTNRHAVTRSLLAAVAMVAVAISLPVAILSAQVAGAASKDREAMSTRSMAQPSGITRLSYVDDTAEGRRSIAGSGHAVKFQRPRDARYLMAIEIYASRYGYPQAPDEDFHVYLLDENQKLIQAIPFPYATIARGDERWYTLSIPAVKVPRQFYVALSFNPHSTKGIYLGFDNSVSQSHSYTGRPTTGFQAVRENRDWMVRAVLAASPALQNPFDDPARR